MARLKEFGSSIDVEYRYIHKRVVFVESEDDVQILAERWFNDRGEWVEFQSCDEGFGGGCSRVIHRVREARSKRIDAFGVVDRDALAADHQWDLFFQTDPKRFAEEAPFGKWVIVLGCWEIENYLLHPEVIEAHLADTRGRARRDTTEILEELFEMACRLLVVVAGNLLLNSYGYRSLNQGFATDKKTPGEVYDLVEFQIRKDLPDNLSDAFEDCIAKLAGFSGDNPDRSLDHWWRLLRILDGKLMIRWICHRYRLGDAEVRFHWASRLKERNLLEDVLDPQLQRVLDATN